MLHNSNLPVRDGSIGLKAPFPSRNLSGPWGWNSCTTDKQSRPFRRQRCRGNREDLAASGKFRQRPFGNGPTGAEFQTAVTLNRWWCTERKHSIFSDLPGGGRRSLSFPFPQVFSTCPCGPAGSQRSKGQDNVWLLS